jgi:hypothetical protein
MQLARCALAFAVAMLAAPNARCAYNFTKVADSNTVGPAGKFFNIDYFPSIDGGTAAFYSRYSFNNVTGGDGVFAGSGGATTAIVKSGDAAPSGTFQLLEFPSTSGAT